MKRERTSRTYIGGKSVMVMKRRISKAIATEPVEEAEDSVLAAPVVAGIADEVAAVLKWRGTFPREWWDVAGSEG